jgi:hypothetical protein
MSNQASPTSKGIVIRDITELSEMRQLEMLQREVWGVEGLDVFPALAIRPQIEVGAILLPGPSIHSNSEMQTSTSPGLALPLIATWLISMARLRAFFIALVLIGFGLTGFSKATG